MQIFLLLCYKNFAAAILWRPKFDTENNQAVQTMSPLYGDEQVTVPLGILKGEKVAMAQGKMQNAN